LTAGFGFPKTLETISIPLGVRYFHPLGFFAGLGVTYVHQDVKRTDTFGAAPSADGDDSFTVVDVSMGYRLPKRLGIVSLSVSNLFDTGFKFQDDSFREFQDGPSIGPYFPERLILGRITLNF
jgi:outer membrane receptor protein involved in Fe transport